MAWKSGRKDRISRVSDFAVRTLLRTRSLTVRDVTCAGQCRHQSAEECAGATELVFPYRGIFARHLGRDQTVGEANQVLFFNAAESYRVSHPVAGGDASLSLSIQEDLLREIAPPPLLQRGARLAFRRQRRRIDARSQALVALLGHGLAQGTAQALEAESLALTLVQRALGPRTSHAADAGIAPARLADRVKLVLASDLSRRWTLSEIAAAVGGSPVYLTQVFRKVEGMPLYRYQLRLRLARALDLLPGYEDLTQLGLDLGFSSHSHFSAAFREAYGRSPSEFRRSALAH
jgi:AraC-like DNA-binding protein